jgi:two-component system response regulator DevR
MPSVDPDTVSGLALPSTLWANHHGQAVVEIGAWGETGVMAGYGPRTARVYLLDDHDVVRHGLRDLMAAAVDIQVVGDSGSAVTGVEDILGHEVDVALLDLQLQDGSGVAVARKLRAADAQIKVLLLTAASDDDALVATVLAGADGYLVKVAPTSDIVGAIRRLAAGRPVLDAQTIARGRGLVAQRRRTVRPPLSDLEDELLDQVLAGAGNAAIAERLGVGRDAMEEATTSIAQVIMFGGRPPQRPAVPRPGGGKHRRED